MNIRGYKKVLKEIGCFYWDKWYKKTILNLDYIKDDKIKEKVKELINETQGFLFYAIDHPNMIYNEFGECYKTDSMYEVILRLEKTITLLELLPQDHMNSPIIGVLKDLLEDIYRVSVKEGEKI